MTLHRLFACVMLLMMLHPTAQAHPVPARFYDRSIRVILTPSTIEVRYRLTVDPQTALRDLESLLSKEEQKKLTSNEQRFDAFAKVNGPPLARQLEAKLDDNPLSLKYVKHDYELIDHLTYDFCFEAQWKLSPGKSYSLRFRDTSYLADKGRVRLTVLPPHELKVLLLSQPSKLLKTKPLIDFKPGDEERARFARVTFRCFTPKEVTLRKKQRP